MEKIVLHHCCAVCSIKLIEHLKNKFDIISVWYNPNIHPEKEYHNRMTATSVLLDENRQMLEIIDEFYEPQEWKNIIKSLLIVNRCEFCYSLRLRRIANYAKEHNIPYFTTTLLASPHQKHKKIKEIMQKIANEFELNFYYYDFRPFYYESKKLIKDKNLYIQKYCGCMFSMEERFKLKNHIFQ